MNKNLDIIAEELFDKIRTQFPKLKLGDENSKRTSDPEKARFFEFDYDHEGEILGTITVSLNEDDGLVVIYSNDVIGDKEKYIKRPFFEFLKELREFAKQHLLKFDTRDIAKSNLEKRDYKHLAKNFGENAMSESKLFGTSMTSYQNLGDAKIIVKHSAPVNQENPAGRAQRIESIYVENAEGERFKYPYRHLNGARALAQHIGHGGTPYDSIGQHITGLSEELGKLRMFKQYVERNEIVSEAMGAVNSKVMERIEAVKKEIHSLQIGRNYEQFAESFMEQESKEIPEEIMNDWIDRLTIRTFNEELKNVFPYIFKLVDESDIPVKELTIEDLVNEAPTINPDAQCTRCKTPYSRHFRFDPEGDPNGKIVSTTIRGLCGKVPDHFPNLYDAPVQEGAEIKEFANYEKQLNHIIGERVDIFSSDDTSKQEAVEKLNQLVAQPIPAGMNGDNAIESLSEIIDDEELMDIFKELADISPETDVRSVLKDYIALKDKENGTNVLEELAFGDEAAPEVPAEEPAAEAPPTEAPAPAAPVTAPAPAAPEAQPAPAMAESFIKEEQHKMFNELKEFIRSMYNVDEGSFPKGVEGVKIACEKKFGDRVGPIAAKIVERMSTLGEMQRIKKLSGIKEADPMDPDSMFKSISNMPGAKKTNSFKSNIDGKQDDSEAGYNTAMGKFRDIAKGIGPGLGLGDVDMTNPDAMQKAVQGKVQGMMPKMPGMDGGSNPTAPGSDASKPDTTTPASSTTSAPMPGMAKDPKTMLQKMPDQQIAAMSGDQAKRMLADLKKMAGLTK
jgi:hypothetical protein